MTDILHDRRTLIAGGTALLVAGATGLTVPARAQGVAPTASMRGGANNYLPGAPIVDRIGGGGFWMTGTVRRAGDGAPVLAVSLIVEEHVKVPEVALLDGRIGLHRARLTCATTRASCCQVKLLQYST